MKVIQYYTKSVYGNPMEYVVNPADAAIILRLTGKRTINSVIRELLHDLSGGAIRFERILEPVK